MSKKLSFFSVVLLGVLVLVFSTAANAGSCIAGFSTVDHDDAEEEVLGISETYVTYDIALYYDAGADGLLYYESPTEVIDGESGEGIDDIYFDILCGTMYGIEVNYTTSNYQRNRIVCADTIHWINPIITPLGTRKEPRPEIAPKRQPNSMILTLSEPPWNRLGDIEIVGYTVACERTPTVASIEFQTINSLVRNDNPASHGGGQRIFPDRDAPGDTSNRRIVRVRAELAPSGGTPTYKTGVRVYFRNFDVDDPSTDTTIDPNGSSGGDNREFANTPQSAGTLSMCTATATNECYSLTNSQGVATAEFSVTRQPGDNFVVAASTDQSYLRSVTVSGTGLQDSIGDQLPTTHARRTALLSTWRRLHIEVDSMEPVSGNFFEGSLLEPTFKLDPNESKEVSINTLTLELNRFENGRLSILAPGSISLHVESNTQSTVRVKNTTSSTITIGDYADFRMYDDDDFNNNDGVLVDGDEGGEIENIPRPPTSLLTQNSDDPNANVLAPAYIWPVYDIGDNNDYTDFAANVAADTDVAVRALFDFDQVATEASTDFWTAYLLGGYQDTLATDDDPETEEEYLGVTDVLNGQGSIVFFEPNGVKDCSGTTVYCSIPGTAAHEIGHLLSAQDGDGGIMDSVSLTFSPTSINRIRSVPHS